VETSANRAPTDSEELEEPLRIDYKKLLFMLAVGVGVALLLVRLIGEREALELFVTAKTEFVILAIVAQGLRYLAVALYTQKLLHFLGHHIPLWPFWELMFAGGAANRIVSAGGAAGIYVRYRFFDRHGLSLGSLAIVLTLQNLMTGVILLGTLLLGLLYMLSHRMMSPGQLLVAVGMLCVMLGLLGSFLVMYRHPRRLKRSLASLAKLVDVPIRRIRNRSAYNPKALLASVNSLYHAVDVARDKPSETAKALGYGVMTLFSDIVCLFFVFHALGFPIKLDVLVVGYVITNYIISLLLMPEGIGVTEVSLTAVYASMGVPGNIVVVATLLFRFIAFWLPIGVGLLAMWDLRRKSLL
jgi:uncharacterized protein (TIRG00374 family)